MEDMHDADADADAVEDEKLRTSHTADVVPVEAMGAKAVVVEVRIGANATAVRNLRFVILLRILSGT